VASRLDWRELDLAGFFSVMAFVVIQIAMLSGRSALGHRRWRMGRVAFMPGVALAAMAPLVVMKFRPSPRGAALLTEEGLGIPRLVRLARRLGDRDHDGWSRYLGGGDCDDSRPDVHPGAPDIPDDGIDQNCIGGDAHRLPAAVAESKPPSVYRLPK